MLTLINETRAENGAGPVMLGVNTGAQHHAEAALYGCFLSHWGPDGTTPDMRYNLAGGQQYSRENVSGNPFCYRAGDGFRAINDNILRQIKKTMDGFMSSPGHRDNIIDPKHRRVNLGIVWDAYNTRVVQQFEGDYIEYDQPPHIDSGVLSLSGNVQNRATLEDPERRDGLSVAVSYEIRP